VLIYTGAPSVDSAIEALDHGALRYLVKPTEPERLVAEVKRAAQLGRLAAQRRRAAQLVAELHADSLTERERLDGELTRAIEQLFVHYQPIVSLSERRVVAFEALVRSAEPTLPHPGALFDAAERLGRVPQLGARIRDLAPLPMIDRREQLFVNLHPTELTDELLYDADGALARIADRVVLEITERASLATVEGLRGRIERLRALGFRLAVDDLGAGYAGLAAFCTLEPDVAKLDMSLVRDIHRIPTKQRVVRSMIDTCRDLGIALVAEGVETAEELAALEELGCDLVQGFLFARPGSPLPEPQWPSLQRP
jgi:EAL domain-containing protein (putative c-di-GMP-specific phosphodiesterase class I)